MIVMTLGMSVCFKIGVGNFVLPSDMQEVAETSEVEVVDLPFVSSVCIPRFATIK